jgi:hypothetical protein
MRPGPVVMVFLLIGQSVLTAVPPAHAFISIDDVRKTLDQVSLTRETARRAIGGATQGFREEAEKFVNDSIDPLLDRVNAIVKGNIREAADSAMTVLEKARSSLNETIANVNETVKERIDDLFIKLTKTINETLAQVDTMMRDYLCKVGPLGNGILIRTTLPFQKPPDEIRVKTPAATHCYRDFPEARHVPRVGTFSGREYFEGEDCEFRLLARMIDPGDPRSMIQTQRYYEKLAGLSAQEQCFVLGAEAKKDLMTRQLMYEEQAIFFKRLREGTDPLTSPSR